METDRWTNDSINGSIGDWLTDDNTSTTRPESFYSIYTTTALHYVRAVIYWMIFVVGVPGNLLVLSVVVWKLVKSPQHQTMTIFVGSLAVSDLGLLFWTTWINALLSVNPEWLFGKVACQMYALWRGLTADCSVANLMFISVDRFVTFAIKMRVYCTQQHKNYSPTTYYYYYRKSYTEYNKLQVQHKHQTSSHILDDNMIYYIAISDKFSVLEDRTYFGTLSSTI